MGFYSPSVLWKPHTQYLTDLSLSTPPPSDAQLAPTKSGKTVEDSKDIASNDDTDTGAETASSVIEDRLTKVKSFVVSCIYHN